MGVHQNPNHAHGGLKGDGLMVEVSEGWWWVRKKARSEPRKARRLRSAHDSSALLVAEGRVTRRPRDNGSLAA